MQSSMAWGGNVSEPTINPCGFTGLNIFDGLAASDCKLPIQQGAGELSYAE